MWYLVTSLLVWNGSSGITLALLTNLRAIMKYVHGPGPMRAPVRDIDDISSQLSMSYWYRQRRYRPISNNLRGARAVQHNTTPNTSEPVMSSTSALQYIMRICCIIKLTNVEKIIPQQLCTVISNYSNVN